MHNGLGKTSPVTKPFGKRVEALAGDFFQKTNFNGFVDRRFLSGASDAAQLGREPEERLHCHIRIQRGILRQIANLGFGLDRGLLDVVTADRDRTAGRRNKPGNHPHGGGLARTVGTEETKDLALGDRERNVVYGQLRTELFG